MLEKGKVEVMPPKKWLHTMKEKSEKCNEAYGSGSQSRIVLDFDKLREAGWRIMHFSSVFSWLQDCRYTARSLCLLLIFGACI